VALVGSRAVGMVDEEVGTEVGVEAFMVVEVEVVCVCGLVLYRM